MRKIYVYAGYYELFVSTKRLAPPFMYQAEFDTVSEAEKWLDENFDTENDTVYYERPIYDESRLADYPYDEETAELYKFDVTENGEILQIEEKDRRKRTLTQTTFVMDAVY